MKLPESLHLYSEDEVEQALQTVDEYFIATSYQDSPFSFYHTYNPPCSIYTFIETYLAIASTISFSFSHPLEQYGPYMTIHLRRTDKVWNHADNAHHGIQTHELDTLNQKTSAVIDTLIQRGIKSVYFCGDDSKVVDEYIRKYSDRLHIINRDIQIADDIERVYFDFYMLSNSKWIVLSQRHSSFSLFASMIKQANLIYLYNSDVIENNSYTLFPHIIHSSSLFQTCTILGHQGFGDLFSQNAIYNHYADIYTKVNIIAANQSIQTVLSASLSHRQNITCILPDITHTAQSQTCLVCHMAHQEETCRRDPNAKCIFVNEPSYSDTIIKKLGAFSFYDTWASFVSQHGQFVDCFYITHFFHPQRKYKGVSIVINSDENQTLVRSMNLTSSYAIIHEPPDIQILRSTITPSLQIINLHGLSTTMTNVIQLILGANEIHIIDSSYSLLIYYLTFSIPELQTKHVVFHGYARPGRDLSIYTTPRHEHWFYLE
jgi:hypothetical protein